MHETLGEPHWQEPARHVRVELGLSLVRALLAEGQNALLERIEVLRTELAIERGVLLPDVEVRDDLTLGTAGLRICVDGEPVREARAASKQLAGAQVVTELARLAADWCGGEMGTA